MFIAIGIFFVFLLLGMPVAFSIGLSGFSFFMIRDLPMTVLVQKSISTSQTTTRSGLKMQLHWRKSLPSWTPMVLPVVPSGNLEWKIPLSGIPLSNISISV